MVSVSFAISPSYRVGDLLISLPRVGSSEHGRSRYEQRCTRAQAARRGVSVNTAVDLEWQSVGQQRPQPLELAHRVLDEPLPAPAGVHGHAEQVVELAHDVDDLFRGR